MKILLINPPRFNGNPMVREMRCAGLSASSIYPPIELAYLAGFLREKTDVKIIDANALDFGFDDIKKEISLAEPDFIVFTSSPASFSADAKIAKIAKQISPKIKTVLQDSHIAPVLGDKIREKFPEIDFFVTTEPLVNVPKILGFEGIALIENHPLPAYDLLPLDKYFSLTYARRKPFATLITSVGCPNRCDFCIVGGATVNRGYGHKWQFKSAGKILSEIKYLLKLGIKDIYFFDETFTVSRQRVFELCHSIISQNLKFNWSCNGRVDTLDEEVIGAMKEAGCWNIMFGIESGSEAMLESAHKGTTLARALEIVSFCKKIGILVSASFVIGLPDETWQTVEETLKIAKKVNPYRAQFVVATPYPGTKLYDDMKKDGLLLSDYDFSGYDAYCVANEPVIKTKYMSAQELLEAQKYVQKKFYFRPSYLLQTLFSVKSLSQLIGLVNSAKYLK